MLTDLVVDIWRKKVMLVRFCCCYANFSLCVRARIKSWVDEGSALGPDRHARDIKSLDQYAMERWEVILHFMVGSSCAVVSQDLAQLLTQAGLMKRCRGNAPCH